LIISSKGISSTSLFILGSCQSQTLQHLIN
jgi:hypothetical protein